MYICVTIVSAVFILLSKTLSRMGHILDMTQKEKDNFFKTLLKKTKRDIVKRFVALESQEQFL